MKQLMLAAAVAAIAATPALAAKAKKPVPPPTPVYSWSGCYVGVNGGYGWNNGSTHYNDPNTTGDPINFIAMPGVGIDTFVPTPTGTGGAGGLGGGGAGCNWQSQQWVFGFEADIDGGRIAGSQTNSATVAGVGHRIGVGPGGTGLNGATATASEHTQLDWLSTIRGRIGFAIQDRLLLFVTGGLALGGASSQGSVIVVNPVSQIPWTGSASTTKAGAVAGGGGEWAFADRWTAKAEFLWYDLGRVSHSLNCAGAFNSISLDTCSTGVFFPTLGNAVSSIHGSIIRFGINYRFN